MLVTICTNVGRKRYNQCPASTVLDLRWSGVVALLDQFDASPNMYIVRGVRRMGRRWSVSYFKAPPRMPRLPA